MSQDRVLWWGLVVAMLNLWVQQTRSQLFIFLLSTLQLVSHFIMKSHNTSTATALFLSLIDAVCIFSSTNSTVLRNKDHQDCLSLSLLIYFNNHPLHISNRFTIHHQQAVYYKCSILYLSHIHVD